MNREETFKFIKEYDLFPSVNFEEGFENFVYPTTQENDAQIKELTAAIDNVDIASDAVKAQLERWTGPFADDSVELNSKMLRATDQIYQVVAAILEAIIEVDWDSYKTAKDGAPEVSRGEYLADEYEDDIRLTFKNRDKEENY